MAGATTIIKFREGDRRWRVVAEVRTWLFSQHRIGQIRQAPMTRIKQSSAKTVYRMVMPTPQGPRTVYVKSYLTRHYLWRPVKYLFRASPAMEEWRLARRLQAGGVPIAPHLAVGETRTAGLLQEATLVTEGLEGYETVADFLERRVTMAAGLRQTFARELGRFVRLLHDRGVLQVDLHGANLLVRLSAKGVPEFRLVDLDGIELRRRVPWRERFSNLISLYIYFASRSSRCDRLRFLRAYLGDGTPRLTRWARRVEEIGWQSLKFSRRERARRCLRPNRDFGVIRGAGLFWQVRRGFRGTKLDSILEGPNRMLSRSGVVIKKGASSTVGRIEGFVLKRANRSRGWRWFKDLFRLSPGVTAFFKAYQLELWGIPTPMALACADWRSWGLLRHSYLVTQEVPGALNLESFLKTHPSLPLAERRELLRALARLVASLHDAGFSHRDLKAQNVLISIPERKLHLIDLDGLNDYGELPLRRVRKDLARLERAAIEQLGVGARERLRFFAEYRRALRDRRLKVELSA